MTYNYWSQWADIDDYTDSGAYTAAPVYVGPSPHLDTDDQEVSYVGFNYTSLVNTRYVVVTMPTGVNMRTMLWQGGTYTADDLPSPPPTGSIETDPGFWRSEFQQSYRVNGTTIPSGSPAAPGSLSLHWWAKRDAGVWSMLSGSFGVYSSSWLPGEWQDVWTGRSLSDATVDQMNAYAATGDLGFAIRWTQRPFPPWTLDLSWVSLITPVLSVPPLRQNQRDDLRQNQRTSQQLTVRQRGYL